MFCTTCGGEIKDTANFCKYCGSKVKKGGPTTTGSPPTPEPETPRYERQPSLYEEPVTTKEPFRPKVEPVPEPTPEPQVVPEPTTLPSHNRDQPEEPSYRPDPAELAQPLAEQKVPKASEPIAEDIIDILYSRERDEDIKQELKELLDEIEKVDQRLEVGLMGRSEAQQEMRDKQELIQALRGERSSLRQEKIPLEETMEELAEVDEKLTKLGEMYQQGKISHENVYQRLRQELLDKKEKLETSQEQEMANAKAWVHDLEREVQKLREEIDYLTAQVGMGEMAEEEAHIRQEEIEIDIYRRELAYHGLKTVLENFGKKS